MLVFCSIMNGVLLIMLMVAVFCTGWLLAVTGLIPDAAYESLDSDSTTNVIKRLVRMMKMHVIIAKRRLNW